MGESTNLQAGRAAALIDELSSAQGNLAQARRAALMLEFSSVRSQCDRRFIAELEAAGSQPRYRLGEFGAMEIGAAVRESKSSVGKVLGIAGRLRAEAPDAWDACSGSDGDIDQEKARRINRALRRLVRDSSKQLLNSVVVDVAVSKTAELLGRWLNQFVARVEPDETEERLRRSMADRYVSMRPDLDGVSAMSALVSSVDAEAIDQVLTAVAAVAEPDDERTLQQRRADALVDLLLGRISNGCGARWDTDSDAGDGDDGDGDDSDGDDSGADDHTGFDGDFDNDLDEDLDRWSKVDGDCADHIDDDGDLDGDRASGSLAQQPAANCKLGDSSGPVEVDDWDLPASAFRPDPRNAGSANNAVAGAAHAAIDDAARAAIAGAAHAALPRITAGPASGSPARPPTGVQLRPVQVTIGVIISAASLFGFSATPGQLADRSALVSAEMIRALAAQPGTLFHRLVTDDKGNLLGVTELGRFPSRKLGLAIAYRDGVCTNPTCTVPARRCDLDHVISFPDGPTAAGNLDEKCRSDHRAKTHAGHRSSRTGPHSGCWTTPTGHAYHYTDDPLSVEAFAADRPDPPCPREVVVAQWSWRAG